LALLGLSVDEAGQQLVGFRVLIVGQSEDTFLSPGHAIKLKITQGGEGSCGHKKGVEGKKTLL
jgi:hypothetical protein